MEFSRRPVNIYKYLQRLDRVTTIKCNSEIYREFKKLCRNRGLTVSYVLNALMAGAVFGKLETGTLVINVNLNMNVNVAKAKASSASETIDRAYCLEALERIERKWESLQKYLDKRLALELLEQIVGVLKRYRKVLTQEEARDLLEKRKQLLEFLKPE